MRARMKLDKLEQKATQHYETLRLLDGTVVNYTSDDAMGALFATMSREDHWLIPFFRQMDTTTGLPGFVRAWEVPCEKHGRGVRNEY